MNLQTMARSSSAAHLPARATFYMYTETELDHGWLEGCAGVFAPRIRSSTFSLIAVTPSKPRVPTTVQFSQRSSTASKLLASPSKIPTVPPWCARS